MPRKSKTASSAASSAAAKSAATAPRTSADAPSTDALLADYALPRVRSMGRSIFDPVWREREHTDGNTEIVHILRGQVKLVCRDYTLEGREGDTLYVPAGMPHRDVFPLNTTFEVYLVQFRWPGEQELLRRAAPSKLMQIPHSAKTRIASDMGELYNEFRRNSALVGEITSLRLMQIILTLLESATGSARDDKDHGQARRRQIMADARQVIHARFAEPLTLDDIAAAVHVSPYHLSHVFSSESGFTLSSYLTQVRMERAAELLRSSHARVAEVAEAVGYRDPQYFSRVFRSRYGEAPSAFSTRS